MRTRAPARELVGARDVAEQLVNSLAHTGAVCSVAQVNGAPGVRVELNRRVVAVVALTVIAGQVAAVHAVGNPAKLRHLGRNAMPS